MAVGIRIKLPGVTQEQFDVINDAIGHEPPAGLIFHASGPIEGGWGVIDFWESRGAFETFATERIAPAMADSGAAAPDIREFPVHEYEKP